MCELPYYSGPAMAKAKTNGVAISRDKTMATGAIRVTGVATDSSSRDHRTGMDRDMVRVTVAAVAAEVPVVTTRRCQSRGTA